MKQLTAITANKFNNYLVETGHTKLKYTFQSFQLHRS